MSVEGLWNRLETLIAARFAAEAHVRDSAHDFGHVRRVAGHARDIGEAEGADVEICVAAAWMHELVYLPKNHAEASQTAGRAALLIPELASQLDLEHRATDIATAVAEHSFSRGLRPTTLESAVLQDADRLDAMGAIGIARCFATGGSFGSALWHPEDPWGRGGREQDDKTFSLDHFERKLLRLASEMNTAAGRALAAVREETMAAFLASLRNELRGA